MPVIYEDAVKEDRMEATRDWHAGGDLQILTDADAVLVTFDLTAGGGTIDNDEWTLEFENSTVAASAEGEAAKARIRNSSGTVGITGLTVDTEGADINLDNVNIADGQNVTLSSAVLKHAPNPSP